MRNTKAIIEDLKKIDLSSYPQKEISRLITESGITAHMAVTLHPGKSIFRARLNDSNEHFFRNVS
jgi:hypothetical protein